MIAVIGAGHAGIEAAMAAANLGHKVTVFAMNLDSVGNMPCNPSIGGVAKGQLVREIDALGGQMGKLADLCCIQFRMLNRGKGPAVRSPRAQADRYAYSRRAKQILEEHPQIRLLQCEISEIETNNGKVTAVKDIFGQRYPVKAAVLANGTYLRSRVVVGGNAREAGPDGLLASNALDLSALGLPLKRFKTGTSPRVHSDTVDYTQVEPQEGESDTPAFSFDSTEPPESRAMCWLTWTNERTHEILRQNLSLSPLYNGTIEGIGPRNCPSIEIKVVKFADKPRHPLFIEPMGLDAKEMYLQGFSSSMPVGVQIEALRTVKGLERVEITRPGYAIEYDCIDSTYLSPALMARGIEGLFAAGQLCGSSGYEEAAAQGLVAGINAALYADNKPTFTLPRSSSYIGTLIDDLVTRGTDEPYRMMTSRSEFRLLLRHDNADERLMPMGFELGLVDNERMERLNIKLKQTETEIKRLERKRLTEKLRRPELKYFDLDDPERPELPGAVIEQVELRVKYEGYIRRQQSMLNSMSKMEERRLPECDDYSSVPGLSYEAAEKLNAARPATFGLAGRIPGISPADITALMIHETHGSARRALCDSRMEDDNAR
ncbi:MAG: tRNA uridine-5-carboxymethylaminomethyl(34) synthesis enzyme MnmG [Oscillospiraceae bacterium]|nr:tRNA uridine-5-carboxymethylaminomethyl(34) synthesis enzyme MnmG [Oscillospiraceae bacterium]